jgi:hypothetical protein
MFLPSITERPLPTDEIYRTGGLVLSTDTNENQPTAVFMVECRECSATSDVIADSRLPVEVWAVKHTQVHPGHDRYRLTTDCFWRVRRVRGRLGRS